jgi:hypothetical protein
MKLLWRVALTLGLCAFVWASFSLAGTSDVFRLQTTINGVIQRGTSSNGIINKVIITSDDLVNLALARRLGTAVPQNEILALINDCATNNMRLVVFDTAGASNLITIGIFSNLTTAAYTRRHYEETITQVTVADISEGHTNGITGGSFYYHGKIAINTNHCPTSFGGQLTGLLGTAFPFIATNIFSTNFIISCTLSNCMATNCMPDCATNCVTNCVTRLDGVTNIFPAVDAIDVIIPRAPITTGKSVGTLPEP